MTELVITSHVDSQQNMPASRQLFNKTEKIFTYNLVSCYSLCTEQ